MLGLYSFSINSINMSKRDYYEVLEVSRDATPELIRKAYHKLALKWHPDKNPDNRDQAEEKFKEIGEAYSILSNADKRSNYDRVGFEIPSHVEGTEFPDAQKFDFVDANNIFTHFFANRDIFSAFFDFKSDDILSGFGEPSRQNGDLKKPKVKFRAEEMYYQADRRDIPEKAKVHRSEKPAFVGKGHRDDRTERSRKAYKVHKSEKDYYPERGSKVHREERHYGHEERAYYRADRTDSLLSALNGLSSQENLDAFGNLRNGVGSTQIFSSATSYVGARGTSVKTVITTINGKKIKQTVTTIVEPDGFEAAREEFYQRQQPSQGRLSYYRY